MPVITWAKGALFSAAPMVGCTDDLSVPPPCTECRQYSRWVPRVIQWAADRNSAFSRLVKAIISTHDDVLASFCGNCLISNTDDCGCFSAKYQALGLPMSFNVWAGECAGGIWAETAIPGCSDGCWKAQIDCLPCRTCITRDLSICSNPDDLALAHRLYDLHMFWLHNRPTGAAIVEALAILFPASNPAILYSGLGRVIVTIGRAPTADEASILTFLLSRINVAHGVALEFVTPC